MQHPDVLSDLSQRQYQDRLREVETWRLAMAARQHRTKYIGELLQRLVAVARQGWRLLAQPKRVKSDDLANLRS